VCKKYRLQKLSLLAIAQIITYFLHAKSDEQLLDSLLSEARRFSFHDSAELFLTGEKAIGYSKKRKLPLGEAEVYFVYGNFFYLRADYSKAQEYYTRALDIAKKNHGDSLENIIEIRRGFIEFESGNWDKSEKVFAAVLEKAENKGDTISIIEALNGLAQTKEKQNKRDETMQHYIRALSLAERSGKKNEIAYILNNLGLLKFNTGQPGKICCLPCRMPGKPGTKGSWPMPI
jgi:tetratricopeptide (TPR) repeat protein